jgi:hypothetical protein
MLINYICPWPYIHTTFPPGYDILFPAFQIAPVGISDQTFTSWSDLQYVPKLRTFLPYKYFLFGVWGAEAPVRPAAKKSQNLSWGFSREVLVFFLWKFWVFFPAFYIRKCQMRSLFLESRADANNAHSYSCPPRGPDVVCDLV